MAASEVASFETNLFMTAGTSEGETLVSGKIVIGEDKKVASPSPLRPY